MTTTLEQVRTGLANAVKNGLDLRSYPYGEADKLNPPCAAVYRDETDPRLTTGDTKTLQFFKLRVYVPTNSARAAVKVLDEFADYYGDRSIARAIADGANWPDDLVDYAQVLSIAPVLIGQLNGQQETYLMQEFDVVVVW